MVRSRTVRSGITRLRTQWPDRRRWRVAARPGSRSGRRTIATTARSTYADACDHDPRTGRTARAAIASTAATTAETSESTTACSSERAEQRPVRRSGGLQHREVADALQRGEVHDQGDDPRGDDPQQHLDEVDRLLAAARRPLQIGLDLVVRQDVQPAGRSRGDRFVITALESGCPANERFWASSSVMKIVWTPKLYREVAALAHDARGGPLLTTTTSPMSSSRLAVDDDLTVLRSAPVPRDLGCADAAGHVAEQVHVGQGARADRRRAR